MGRALAAGDVSDSLRNLAVGTQEAKDQDLSAEPRDGNISDSSGDAPACCGDYVSEDTHEVTPESGVFYATNGYATHPGYHYEYLNGVEYEEYPRYVGLGGGVGPGVYAENGSVVYHPGYAYASHPYGAYSAGPFPPILTDSQVYGHPYTVSTVYAQYPLVEADHNSEGISKDARRPVYPVAVISPHSTNPRGVMAVHTPRQNYRASSEGLRASAPPWVDTKGNKQDSVLQQPTPQPLKSTSSPTLPGALGTAFPPLTKAVLSSNSGTRGRGSERHDAYKPNKGKGVSTSDHGNGSLDEQSKGPRTKVRFQRLIPATLNQAKGQAPVEADEDFNCTVRTKEEYNRADFATFYEEAKFFIIKSYNEDDVHKSIKYRVWASSPTGNKRLDAAYREAQVKSAKGSLCPVFLFFSVNSSGQFCGVAEMTGPVDFVKTVDFWQQEKCNGCFPVKWHIIKDIPNGHFRHIILENNDNKPVTHSRDTQEVLFPKGVQMLKICKNLRCNTSILDDFDYYETRQKAMQDKRSRQRQEMCKASCEGSKDAGTPYFRSNSIQKVVEVDV